MYHDKTVVILLQSRAGWSTVYRCCIPIKCIHILCLNEIYLYVVNFFTFMLCTMQYRKLSYRFAVLFTIFRALTFSFVLSCQFLPFVRGKLDKKGRMHW